MPETLDAQFHRIFMKYLEINKRTVADLVKVKAGQLAFLLWKKTAAKKASNSKIASDVKKQGWALVVPRGFRDKPEFRRQPGEPDNNAALARFQEAVINLRVRGIGFPSVGWLASAKKLGVANRANIRAEKIEGDCEIFIQSHVSNVKMINWTPGAAVLMRKYPIAREAIQEMIRDMQTYIDAKQQGKSGSTVEAH